MANKSGTAVRRRGKDRLEDILRAGQSILIASGYAGLSLGKIAEYLGISKGNVTYYFADKDALLKAILEDLLATHEADFEWENAQFPDDPIGRYRAYVSYLVNECKNPEVRGFFYQLWALASHNGVARQLRDRVYDQFFHDTIRRLTPVTGHLADSERRNRAMALMALIEGLHVVLGLSDELLGSLENYERTVLDQAMWLAEAP